MAWSHMKLNELHPNREQDLSDQLVNSTDNYGSLKMTTPDEASNFIINLISLFYML